MMHASLQLKWNATATATANINHWEWCYDWLLIIAKGDDGSLPILPSHSMQFKTSVNVNTDVYISTIGC